MSVSVSRSDDKIALVLGDRFDFSSVDQFRKGYESLGDVNGGTVTIDFQNTRYMDSSALGMLINAKSFFTPKQVKVEICNTNDQIKKILSISRFDKKFDIK